MTTTRQLRDAGVSIWLDDLSRSRIVSGGLERLMIERDVVGITTNPTIFANAFGEGTVYRDQLAELRRAGASPTDTVVALMTDDVRAACDILMPVYEATTGLDGRVSLEVSPAVAHDPAATLAEVIHLHSKVDRRNVLIKIPATPAGVTAIAEATAAGISVNVTLIFGLGRYREVVDAYLTGLERAKADGRDLGSIHSVASFFVSRVDVEVDKRLTALGGPEAERLTGRAAIANARLAYEIFALTLQGARWLALARSGANPQRPLWASTGVKDPGKRDTVYVEELVASNTVNTMPEKTLEAVWNHAHIRPNTIDGTYDEARQIMEDLEHAGVMMDDVVASLEAAGIAVFTESWERLLHATMREQGDPLGAATPLKSLASSDGSRWSTPT